jgi:predicted metal-dependent peptidase
MTNHEHQMDRVNGSLDRLCHRYKNLSDAIGYLQIKPCTESTPKAMTDGFCITFNPAYTESCTEDQLDTLMMHEILHIIDWHFAGSEDKDPYLWNLSCDFRVNSILRRLNFNLEPMSFDNPKFDDLSPHEIYDQISAIRAEILARIDECETTINTTLKAINGRIRKEDL